MGWTNVGAAVIEVTTVIVAGPTGGVFIYYPAAGTGNLVGSWAAQAGTDAYQNSYPQGIQISGSGLQTGLNMVLNDGQLAWTEPTWTAPGTIFANQVVLQPTTVVNSPATDSAATSATLELIGRQSGGTLSSALLNADSIELDPIGAAAPLTAFVDSSSTQSQIDNGDSWHTLILTGGWTGHSQGGWTNGLRYRRLSNGDVEFDGSITAPATPAGTTIGTFPAGYRPSANKMFVAVYTGNSPKLMDFNITSGGAITYDSDLGTTGSGVAYVTSRFSTF